ncbi:mechanosensitive ion channel family protein [Falsibacillus pallidus]|uniref:Small conductance mechanosensitive channel n=1 Tax=Falsibacillus pallidus TaxID=493781 RepID=A0A370GFX3_9BACI|nr:mechanosensitive ion channel family protein [Falsibacillus pallidus]RDI40883.1 small conductance mechanosensitive channel [Falsibacillus pallidus]
MEKQISGPLDTLYNKITNEDLWISIGAIAIKIIAILLIAGLIIKIGKVAIRNIFKVRAKSPLRFTERRETTLLKLLENVLVYVVYFIAVIMVLSALTINVTGLLAGAGIVGLAIGFGAQNLVRDIITGFFIIFEDQFSVGDYVRIGATEGTVEEIGLRTTKIKSWTGELHIIPNGNISEVTNFSLNNSVAVVDINLSYEENIEEVEKIINDLLLKMPHKYEELVQPPELLGVQNMAASQVTVRVVAETLPMKHWYIARQLRKEIKSVLDERGVDIPFPRMVLYSRQEEEKAKLPNMRQSAEGE